MNINDEHYSLIIMNIHEKHSSSLYSSSRDGVAVMYGERLVSHDERHVYASAALLLLLLLLMWLVMAVMRMSGE